MAVQARRNRLKDIKKRKAEVIGDCPPATGESCNNITKVKEFIAFCRELEHHCFHVMPNVC